MGSTFDGSASAGSASAGSASGSASADEEEEDEVDEPLDSLVSLETASAVEYALGLETVADVTNEVPVSPVKPVQLLLEDESPVIPVDGELVVMPGRKMAT